MQECEEIQTNKHEETQQLKTAKQESLPKGCLVQHPAEVSQGCLFHLLQQALNYPSRLV